MPLNVTTSIHGRFREPVLKTEWLAFCILLPWMFFAGCSNCFAGNPETSALSQQLDNLYKAGKFREAIPLAQQVLAYNERVFGPENPNTATSLNDLAELYRSTGQYAKAEPLFQRALRIREKAFGPDDAAT